MNAFVKCVNGGETR